MIEYRACVTVCPYVIYAPLLKLREPTVRTFADVIDGRQYGLSMGAVLERLVL